MRSKKQLLKNWKVYSILDSELFSDKKKLLSKFYELTESRVDAIQLRFKYFTPDLYKIASKMCCYASKKKIFLIINDRPEIALSLGASGVHLGKSDVSPEIARCIMGKKAIIGRTIRGVRDFNSLRVNELDYVSIGPVFSTPFKKSLRTIDFHQLKKLLKKTNIPVVAIGGINKNNVSEITRLGIKTVAFIRYTMGKNTKRKIDKIRKLMQD